MQRNGKIARLSREIRDELNTRLAEGEPGGPLLEWLNGLPAVKAVVERSFGNNPITKQNLSEWRAGGFVEWEARQEMLAQAREMAADAKEFNKATAGKLTDHLATSLAARYASLLSSWNGEADEPFRQKLRVLRSMCQDIAELRKGDHSGGWLKLEQDRVEREEEATEEAVVAQFQRWIENNAVKDTICRNWKSPEEKKEIISWILGKHPDWPAYYKKMHAERMRKLEASKPVKPAKAESNQNQTGQSPNSTVGHDVRSAASNDLSRPQTGVQPESNQSQTSAQAESNPSPTAVQPESHQVQPESNPVKPESHPVQPVQPHSTGPYYSARVRREAAAAECRPGSRNANAILLL